MFVWHRHRGYMSGTPPRTQKARGVVALARGALWPYRSFPWVVVVQEDHELEEAFGMAYGFAGETTIFARPCPVRPRHGFVESRPVRTLEEVQTLWEALRRVDPEGELLLVPFVEAKYNAILTPTSLTIGPGHDGATSGRGAITLPLPFASPIAPSEASKLIAPGEVPYVEAVFGNGGWVFTQFRSGPPPANTGDYIPERMEVRNVVVVPEGLDLVEWEAMVKDFPPGTAVYHPGGAIASHYGVHCVASRVPYITSHEPQVGEVLEPLPTWGREENLLLREVIMASFAEEDDDDGLLPLALALVHSIGAFVAGKPDVAAIKALGWAIAYLARACAGASVGELRYSPRALRLRKTLDIPPRGGRDEIYADALGWGLREIIYALAISKEDFGEGGWSTGYGGARWARATKYALKYVESVASFIRRPSRRALSSLMRRANTLLHVSHNNGWYLGKWRNPTRLNVQDFAAENPATLAIASEEFVDFLFVCKDWEPQPQPQPAGEPPNFQEEVEKAMADYRTMLESEPLAERLANGLVDPEAIKRGAEKEMATLFEGLKDAIVDEAKVGNGVGITAQVIVGWNSMAHLQFGMPRGFNRSYGHAMDISYNNPIAVWLAIEWAHGERIHQSLNSEDSISTYVRLPAVWVPDRDVFVHLPTLSKVLGRQVWTKLYLA